MMSDRRRYLGGVVVQWDDDTGLAHHFYDATGAELPAPASPVAYTPDEQAAAQARTTAATRATNLQTIFTAMGNARQANLAFVQAVQAGTATQADYNTETVRLARQNNALMRVVYALLNDDPTALDGTN